MTEQTPYFGAPMIGRTAVLGRGRVRCAAFQKGDFLGSHEFDSSEAGLLLQKLVSVRSSSVIPLSILQYHIALGYER
jgi:hypothetical protein